MKRRPLVFPALFLLGAGILTSAVSRESEVKIDIRDGSVYPGEILRVFVHFPGGLRAAHVRFDGKKYATVPAGPNPGLTRMALIGLDLSLEPGVLPLVAVAGCADGRSLQERSEVRVLAGNFPVKHLRVDQKYVTPPSHVLERIRRETSLMRTIYAGESREWLATGRFIEPAEGKVQPNFGERRIFNGEPRSPHSGIDLSAPLGTPVVASNAGRVVFAGDLYYSGNTVVLDHGLGLFTIYCHLSEMEVGRGDRAATGDPIGKVGATGRVTGPHLHWSVRLRGSRVDPLSLLELVLD